LPEGACGKHKIAESAYKRIGAVLSAGYVGGYKYMGPSRKTILENLFVIKVLCFLQKSTVFNGKSYESQKYTFLHCLLVGVFEYDNMILSQ